MRVIDATGAVAGRLASVVAKMLLQGEEVVIVNAEKAIISGDPQAIIRKFKERREIGSVRKGPYYPRMPDRILRRMVRGMLPREQKKGRDAYKRLRVYIGVPEGLPEPEKIESVIKKFDKYITLGDLSRELGARW